jgi:IS5 family transposase
MFKLSEAQRDLFAVNNLMSPEKQSACEKSWAGAFRSRALPILLRTEPEFAELYDSVTGRPNRSVALVLGVLILKEMSDLTDEEALAALDFDLRWLYAFDLSAQELHLCQKTLHNFRVKLIASEKGKLVFRRVTDELIAGLGIDVKRQRLDSTHILSNFARLNRLGLLCETIRIFMKTLKKLKPELYEGLCAGIKKRHGEESCYADARKEDGPRRLGVVARDVYRLVEQFKIDATISETAEFKLLTRLLADQCEVTEKPQLPRDDDDDHDGGAVPVKLRDPREVESSSLQTPHDADVTYSGHKGKGYEVQLAETCVVSNPIELITHVAITPSSGCDQYATVPMVEALEKAGQKPEELVADTGYSGARNAAQASRHGVNLLAPAPAKGKPEAGKFYPVPEARCPQTQAAAGEWLRRQEAQANFEDRYAIRAGIEGLNSEMKRVQGLGKLRVRGGKRVELTVYLKATACNVKRALKCWLEPGLAVEGAVALA